MIRNDLTVVASWLFHNEPSNKTRIVIYDKLEKYGRHPSTPVDIEFNDNDAQVIQRVQESIKNEDERRKKMLKKLTKIWRKRR
tara:strand:- start:483 stop:731 length:249 start_codon:yes stop_codon:yes gene_type:complete